MNDHPHFELSQSGTQRKQAILATVLEAAKKRHQRRLAMRSGVAVAGVCLFVGLIWSLTKTQDQAPHPVDHRVTERTEYRGHAEAVIVSPLPKVTVEIQLAPQQKISSDKQQAFIQFELIKTDPDVLDRYLVKPKSRSESKLVVEYLDDERLLEELTANNLPYGLARIGNVVRLVPHHPIPARRPRSYEN